MYEVKQEGTSHRIIKVQITNRKRRPKGLTVLSFCRASRTSLLSKSNGGRLSGIMLHFVFIVSMMFHVYRPFFFLQSLALGITSSGSECNLCWGRLLDLHVICPHSFTRFLFQDLLQNQALGSIMCSLQKESINNLGPLQCHGHAGAMIVSNDLFLIHRFPRNLGQDLKLAEGKQRSGSWRCPSTTWVWPANGVLYRWIGWIGVWTASHLWYYIGFLFSSLDGMRQRIPRNQCMLVLDLLKCLLFAKCSWNQYPRHLKNTPRPLRPREKSQLNLTFHLEWWMVLHKPNQKPSLSYQQDFAYLI